ncbi:helix-turn-helix transcriptional regulator [Leptospira ellisii]|uniref:Transcriptional regulator n=1 Tax=Leptospira ellisii TaxID=2023197 RepID=A0A2N0BGI5_9LEPT|nr:helix-turn-helix transcriptional regulator [Leptospira ellisii]MDV6237544.1 helix-turn-helix transcriptional regulator [Leptospira ellisii]PJZ92805.1 transcriptional regulator [Leptospira ellisii]PKA03109.1 transcriptional regulator [Leptospira ellisii]
MVKKETRPGERLAEAMKFLGLNQAEFADSLEMTQQTISKWCSGKLEIQYITALGIEAKHKISHKWLLYGEGGMILSNEDQKVQISIFKKATELVRKVNSTKGLPVLIDDFVTFSNKDQTIILEMVKSLKNKSN